MFLVGPVSFRKEDKRVIRLVREGQTTHDALFEAQFGEWPVRGLRKDTVRNNEITFKGFLRDKNYNPLRHIFRLAYAGQGEGEINSNRSSEQGDTIYLNGFLLSPLSPVAGILATRLAYARLHDVMQLALPIAVAPPVEIAALALMAMSSYRYAVASSLVKLVAPSLSTIVGEEQIHTFHVRENTQAVAAGAFQSVANDWFENQTGARKTVVSISQSIDALLTLMPRAYYASDYELQARIHNIMVKGYPVWGKIPETTEEFYAALMDMGIKTPAPVKKYFRENPSYASVFNKHSAFQEGYLSPPNAEINIGLNSYRDNQILEMYWRDCLPYLYADLLVKYGDSKGMARMGYADELDMTGLPIKQDLLPR